MRRIFLLILVSLALVVPGALWALAQSIAVPPDDLFFADAEQIALTTRDTPAERVATATYANETDAARVAVRLTDHRDDPIAKGVEWGRITTQDAVNNVALGIVPAWAPPAGFDRDAFIAATGCADARLVSTDTPRVDVTSDELGYFIGFALPPETPISGVLALCLTEGEFIVQVTSAWVTAAEPLASPEELVATTVAWLDAPEPDEPAATCEAGEGEFRVDAVIEGCG